MTVNLYLSISHSIQVYDVPPDVAVLMRLISPQRAVVLPVLVHSPRDVDVVIKYVPHPRPEDGQVLLLPTISEDRIEISQQVHYTVSHPIMHRGFLCTMGWETLYHSAAQLIVLTTKN